MKRKTVKPPKVVKPLKQTIKTFDDVLHTSVYISKSVLSGDLPILNVYHFNDGYWQFTDTDDEVSDDDIEVVTLREVIEIDPTVQEVSDLPYDWIAFRETLGGQWIKNKL